MNGKWGTRLAVVAVIIGIIATIYLCGKGVVTINPKK